LYHFSGADFSDFQVPVSGVVPPARGVLASCGVGVVGVFVPSAGSAARAFTLCYGRFLCFFGVFFVPPGHPHHPTSKYQQAKKNIFLKILKKNKKSTF